MAVSEASWPFLSRNLDITVATDSFILSILYKYTFFFINTPFLALGAKIV